MMHLDDGTKMRKNTKLALALCCIAGAGLLIQNFSQDGTGKVELSSANGVRASQEQEKTKASLETNSRVSNSSSKFKGM